MDRQTTHHLVLLPHLDHYSKRHLVSLSKQTRPKCLYIARSINNELTTFIGNTGFECIIRHCKILYYKIPKGRLLHPHILDYVYRCKEMLETHSLLIRWNSPVVHSMIWILPPIKWIPLISPNCSLSCGTKFF